MKQKSYIIDNKELMSEWDWAANADLDPAKITHGSHIRAWWKCVKCGHKWNTEVKSRVNGRGCAACSGKILVVGKNDLLTVRPDIAAQWHPTKNGNLRPQDISYGWGKKVWWKCKDCGYEWQVAPNSRTNKKYNCTCPCCANKVVVPGKNDLETKYPEIAKEWHPDKNGSVTPRDVTGGCHKKVWWLCPHGHEYMTIVLYRTRQGTNCPICNIGRKTSFSEQAFYYYIKQVFPDAVNQYKADFLGKMELDIYVPSIRCAIEYDGKPWHGKGFKGKYEREKRKYKFCIDNNIELIRIREGNTDDIDIADYQYKITVLNKKNYMDNTIKDVLKHLYVKSKSTINYVNIDTERDRFKILGMMNVVWKANSFAEKHPEIAKEWQPTKNENLAPYMFMPGSKVKVWWICPKCGCEYETTIGHRTTRNTGCPKCGIEKVAQAHRRKINMIDSKTNKVIATFNSIDEAFNKTCISKGNICMACNGQRKTTGGYKWQYIDGKASRKSPSTTKAVCMISRTTGKVLKQFNSVRDAAQETGLFEGSIRKCCMGDRKSAHGYVWRYAGDTDYTKYNKNKKQLEIDFSNS